MRVPDEVYLVIAPVGGREDFAALFHEAGHTEHYAHVDASLPVEDRYLGDNSVTEGFAFLFEHLASDPEWLRRRLGIEDPEPIVRHERAARLVFLRRYAAKLAYELELHGGGSIEGLDAVYAPPAVRRRARGLAGGVVALRRGPVLLRRRATCAPGRWRPTCARRCASASARRGSTSPEAGAFLRELWSAGQGAAGGEGILERVGGSRAGLRRGARRGQRLARASSPPR